MRFQSFHFQVLWTLVVDPDILCDPIRVSNPWVLGRYQIWNIGWPGRNYLHRRRSRGTLIALPSAALTSMDVREVCRSAETTCATYVYFHAFFAAPPELVWSRFRRHARLLVGQMSVVGGMEGPFQTIFSYITIHILRYKTLDFAERT